MKKKVKTTTEGKLRKRDRWCYEKADLEQGAWFLNDHQGEKLAVLLPEDRDRPIERGKNARLFTRNFGSAEWHLRGTYTFEKAKRRGHEHLYEYARDLEEELIDQIKRAPKETTTFSKPAATTGADTASEAPHWREEISACDGLEIHPVHIVEIAEDGTVYCEPCEPEQAQFWSVYGHLRSGGVLCFEDFASASEARHFAHALLEEWPNLRTFGLWDES